MRIGVGLDGRLGLSLGELTDLGGEAARLGFESIWTPFNILPDAFHICSAWARATEEVTKGGITAGIAVIPAPRQWKAETLAAQAATLGEISHGNFILGIGTGGYADAIWDALGLPHRPITIMREYLEALRRIIAGEVVSYEGIVVRTAGFSLERKVNVPIYLGALGPQMLHLAGTHADGVALNWATPVQVAESRKVIADAAQSVGREALDVPLAMYIRVCIDDDLAAARRALGAQVLGYALARPGMPKDVGYRSHFARMGFDEALTELEERRDAGMVTGELTTHIPEEMLRAVGYYGSAKDAPNYFAQLARGLDEVIVRIITARRGVEPVIEAMQALTPEKIHLATK